MIFFHIFFYFLHQHIKIKKKTPKNINLMRFQNGLKITLKNKPYKKKTLPNPSKEVWE